MELGSEDVDDFMEEIFPLEIEYTVQKLGAFFMTVLETSGALNLLPTKVMYISMLMSCLKWEKAVAYLP